MYNIYCAILDEVERSPLLKWSLILKVDQFDILWYFKISSFLWCRTSPFLFFLLHLLEEQVSNEPTHDYKNYYNYNRHVYLTFFVTGT